MDHRLRTGCGGLVPLTLAIGEQDAVTWSDSEQLGTPSLRSGDGPGVDFRSFCTLVTGAEAPFAFF